MIIKSSVSYNVCELEVWRVWINRKGLAQSSISLTETGFVDGLFPLDKDKSHIGQRMNIFIVLNTY